MICGSCTDENVNRMIQVNKESKASEFQSAFRRFCSGDHLVLVSGSQSAPLIAAKLHLDLHGAGLSWVGGSGTLLSGPQLSLGVVA